MLMPYKYVSIGRLPESPGACI